MINSKKKIKEYLQADGRLGTSSLKDWILHNEKWYIWHYIVALRHVEYYMNTCKRKSLLFLFWWYLYKYYSLKTHITIYPNTCGKGLIVYHLGDMLWVKKNASIGDYCTLRAGGVFGNKGADNDPIIKVGHHVDFGLGVKCFGPVSIGNHVVVGAMSVITKDIPDYCMVAGNPAKVIKKFDLESNRWIRV